MERSKRLRSRIVSAVRGEYVEGCRATFRTSVPWHSSNVVDPMLRIARAEAKRLALAVKDITIQLAENHKALAQLTETDFRTPTTPGVGPVTGSIIICAYSHHGRIRSETAFAALGGAPRPASSGNTTRHPLNRSGDGQLNRAFDVIVRTLMSLDPETKD
ncbi:Transposase IS116/IS110/IS902 family protein [Arthrobacter sp. 31Cvi3.1E]|nr:Transposase IS116/IS110/IS902 family protein [Arthrobacter sp. 31Cvi3.1E]